MSVVLLAFLATAAATWLFLAVASEWRSAEFWFHILWGWCLFAGLALLLTDTAPWPVLFVCAVTPWLTGAAYGIVDIWWKIRRQRKAAAR